MMRICAKGQRPYNVDVHVQDRGPVDGHVYVACSCPNYK